MALRIFLLTILIILICPAEVSAYSARVPMRKIKGQQSCDLIRLLRYNGARNRPYGKGHSFTARYFTCRVNRNDRRSVINGIKVHLNFPVTYVNGTPYITLFDWQKTLRPLLYPATLQKHQIRTITIDMGHGGSDPGAIGRFSKEKNITFKIGQRLGQILRQYGYRVHFTRYRDVKIPLERIGKLQRSHRSDLFVSIHVNSAKDKSVSGIETFCLTPAYAPSSGAQRPQKSVRSGNRFDNNNLALAWNIQRQLLRRTGAVDRSVKRANFVVLRNLNAPGVLVEVGFISNRLEERKLNNTVYIDALARGIADGIISYRKSMK